MDAKQNPPLWHLLLILMLTVACSKKGIGGHKPQKKNQTLVEKHKKGGGKQDNEQDTKQVQGLDELQKAPTPKEKKMLLKEQWNRVDLEGVAASSEDLWEKAYDNLERWSTIGLASKNRPFNGKEKYLAFHNLMSFLYCYVQEKKGIKMPQDEDLAEDVRIVRDILNAKNVLYIHDPENPQNSWGRRSKGPDKYQITRKEADVTLKYLPILEAFATKPQD